MTTAAPKTIPFKKRLAELMPRQTVSRRGKIIHDYLTGCIRETRRRMSKVCSDEYAEKVARENEEVFKRDGVVPDEFSDFAEWHKDRVSKVRAEAGRAGGEMKHANRADAKARQVRKQTKPKLNFRDPLKMPGYN